MAKYSVKCINNQWNVIYKKKPFHTLGEYAVHQGRAEYLSRWLNAGKSLEDYYKQDCPWVNPDGEIIPKYRGFEHT